MDYIVNNEGSTQRDGKPPYQSKHNATKKFMHFASVFFFFL